MTNKEAKAAADELGALNDELAAARARLKREDTLKKALREYTVNHAADRSVLIAGARYVVELHPCEEQTKIRNMREVYRALKSGRFLELCSMTLKNLKDAVTPELYQTLVVRARTGSRDITISAKGARA